MADKISVWILLVLCHVTVYGQPMTGQSGTSITVYKRFESYFMLTQILIESI